MEKWTTLCLKEIKWSFQKPESTTPSWKQAVPKSCFGWVEYTLWNQLFLFHSAVISCNRGKHSRRPVGGKETQPPCLDIILFNRRKTPTKKGTRTPTSFYFEGNGARPPGPSKWGPLMNYLQPYSQVTSQQLRLVLNNKQSWHSAGSCYRLGTGSLTLPPDLLASWWDLRKSSSHGTPLQYVSLM